VLSSAAALMEIRAQAERDSGVGLKLFGFIADSVFTFIPEYCPRSSRNSVRNHPGIAFTFPRIPQPSFEFQIPARPPYAPFADHLFAAGFQVNSHAHSLLGAEKSAKLIEKGCFLSVAADTEEPMCLSACPAGLRYLRWLTGSTKSDTLILHPCWTLKEPLRTSGANLRK
jgi:hypothetical protein